MKLTVQEVQEHIVDIRNYYLENAQKNNDTEMINHWKSVLKYYEQILFQLENQSKYM